MTPSIYRDLEFDAGHQLLKHEGKCAHTHGHRYRVRLVVRGKQLDGVGRVIDFGVLKAVMGGWLDEHLDHGFIAERGDPIIDYLRTHEKKHFVMDEPPTAENLARLIYRKAVELLSAHAIEVVRVTIAETPNAGADWPPVA